MRLCVCVVGNAIIVALTFACSLCLAADSNDQLALIINGFTLRYALDEEFGLGEKFLQLSRRCKSIICCRVSPAQKAQGVCGFNVVACGRVCATA